METNNKLKDYICIMPFTYLSPFEESVDACCGDWCDIKVPYRGDLEQVWTSEEMQEFRQSILDGSYRHCNAKCPFKSNFLRGGGTDLFIPKNSINLNSKDWSIDRPRLKHIKFCSDETCNLHCKSCRDHRILTDGKYLHRQLFELDSSDFLRNQVERIDLLGSGDPFVSKPSRHWLLNFDPKEYPALKYIHIHSNGQLWTSKMNERISKVLPFIHSYEISIDAACKETYEKVRRGGSWDILQNNLNSIIEINREANATFSFVIQKLNWQEIIPFYRYIKNLKDSHGVSADVRWYIRYSPAEKWKTTIEEYEEEINIRKDSAIVEKVSKDLVYLRSLKDNIHIDSAL